MAAPVGFGGISIKDLEAVYDACQEGRIPPDRIYFLDPDAVNDPWRFWARGFRPRGARRIVFSRGRPGFRDVYDWKRAVRRWGLLPAAYLFQFHGLKWQP